MMAFSAFSKHIVKRFCPNRFTERTSGVFVKCLQQKLRTGQASLHNHGLTATPRDRSHPRVLLHFVGSLVALTVRSPGCQQTGYQSITRTWEARKNVIIRVVGEQFTKLLFVLFDRCIESGENACQHLYRNNGRGDDRHIFRHGYTIANDLYPLGNALLGTASLRGIKLPYLGFACSLNFFQPRPLLEESERERGVETLSNELKCLGKISL